MFDPDTATGECLIRGFLLRRQFLATWFLGRHERLDLGEREGQEAEILQELAPSGQRIGRGIGHPFIMDTTFRRLAQKEDGEGGIDQQEIFTVWHFFLPL